MGVCVLCLGLVLEKGACLVVGGMSCIISYFHKHHVWDLCSVLGACLVVGGPSCGRRHVLYNLRFFINTMCGSLCSVLEACLVVGGPVL